MNSTSIGVQIADRFLVTDEEKEKETCHFRRKIGRCGASL